MFFLLRENCSSYCHYSVSFPGALAGLLHPDDDKTHATAERFRKAVAAYEMVKDIDTPAIQAMLRRHPFRTQALQFCIAYAKARNFDFKPGTQWAEWISVVFRGQLGTVMIENSAKALRDHETRDNSNKVMQHTAAWSVLKQSGLLNDYGRKEIGEGSSGAVPDSFGEQLFVPTCAADKKHKLPFDDIMKAASWPSYTAQSQKLIYGQEVALMWLYEQNRMGEADSLQAVRFVPEGQIIADSVSGEHLLVLQALEVGALCWLVDRVCSTG